MSKKKIVIGSVVTLIVIVGAMSLYFFFGEKKDFLEMTYEERKAYLEKKSNGVPILVPSHIEGK